MLTARRSSRFSERDRVEPSDDPGGERLLAAGERTTKVRRGAIAEELDGRGALSLGRRGLERRQREDALIREAEPLPRRGEEREPRDMAPQLIERRTRGGIERVAVVEDQHGGVRARDPARDAIPALVLGHLVEPAEPEPAADRVPHAGGVTDLLEPARPRPGLSASVAIGLGEARLAHPGGADDRDDPTLGDQGAHTIELGPASDEP